MTQTSSSSTRPTTIGFLGGTGNLGKALAMYLAVGYGSVLIGSREKEKAEAAVHKLESEHSLSGELKGRLRPATNREVAESSDIVLATLPAKHAVQGIKELVGHFRGDQLLISTAAPTPKVGRDYLPILDDGEGAEDGLESASIAKRIKEELLPKSIEVAAAFQTVPADALSKEKKLEADIPVACDDEGTYDKTARVIRKIEGLRPFYLGSLETATALEGLTSVLLNVAAHNDLKSPTIRFNSTA